MNNMVKVLVALAAGAAAGAVLGILFAPAKGRETRENLEKKGKQFADDLADKIRNIKEHCNEGEGSFN